MRPPRPAARRRGTKKGPSSEDGAAYRQMEHTSAGMQEGATAPSCAIRSGGVYAAKERLQAAFPEKPHWGGLEGRSPPNTIRTRRHARRVRKPCAARFPCTFPRPRPRRRGNVSWRKRPATPAFFDKLRKGRQPLPVPSAAAACTPPRSGCRPLSPKNPIGEVWRAEALQLPSEPGDMRGGFGSLAQQGFPARFPGRAPGAGETCPGEKGRQRRPFSTS